MVLPEQHRNHHQVTRAERAIQPVGITETCGKLIETLADAVCNQRHTLFAPRLVASRNLAVTISRIGGSTVLRRQKSR
jgi:hypothetical protein